MAKSNVDVHQLAKDVKVELNLLRDEVLKYEVDAQLARKEVVAVSHKIKTLEDVNAIKEVEETKMSDVGEKASLLGKIYNYVVDILILYIIF